MCLVIFFFFYCYGDHRDLHSFPTRRSSDLIAPTGEARVDAHRGRPAGHAGPAHSQGAFGGTDTWLGNQDRKSTRLNSSHVEISYAVFCLKKKNIYHEKNLTNI